MPRNSDFEYSGLKVEHADNWNANDYHNHSLKKKPSGEEVGGFPPVKGMVSPRENRVHTEQPDKALVDQTREAAMRDWVNRGLSDNKIENY